MRPVQEISIKVNVKELAGEIPLEVFVYERGLSDVIDQLVKTFGMEEVLREVKAIEQFLNEGGKL